MKQPFCFRLFIAVITAWCISPAVSAQPVSPKILDDIFAPVVVGTPPVNAFNGLFRCPDGEIRHYGDDGFLFSRDDGLTWKHRRFGEVDASGKAAGGGRPLGMNPKTGTCLRLVGGKGGMFVHRSSDGPDGQYTVQKIDDRHLIMVRPPYFLRLRPRVLFAAHGQRPERITVFRSDDDGLTWARSVLPPGPAFVVEPPHQGPRWENWCVEPTILELQDGRLWMLARTSRDNHHECYSEDAGESWSPWQPSRFYGTLTMPTLFRLPAGQRSFGDRAGCIVQGPGLFDSDQARRTDLGDLHVATSTASVCCSNAMASREPSEPEATVSIISAAAFGQENFFSPPFRRPLDAPRAES